MGFEVGIAIPDASANKEFSLNIKTEHTKMSYIDKDEISVVLNVFKVCLNKTSGDEKIFWKAYEESRGVNFEINKENLKKINSLISEAKDTKKFVFQASSIDTMSLFTKTDGKWRVFFPLDGTDNIIEKIRMVLSLKDSIFNFSNIEWVVGNYGLAGVRSTPIFLIKNTKIHLVLTDFIDVLIFNNGWKDVDELSELKFDSMFNGLLSIKSLDQTLSQDKVDYAIQLANKLKNKGKKNIILNHPFKNLSFNEKLLERARSFVGSQNQSNLDFIGLMQQITMNEYDKKDLSNFYNKRDFFSLLDKLNSLVYNGNYNKLKDEFDGFDSIEKIRENFHLIKEIISNFERDEFKYVLNNKRFKHIFGVEIMQMLSKFMFY